MITNFLKDIAAMAFMISPNRNGEAARKSKDLNKSSGKLHEPVKAQRSV